MAQVTKIQRKSVTHDETEMSKHISVGHSLKHLVYLECSEIMLGGCFHAFSHV